MKIIKFLADYGSRIEIINPDGIETEYNCYGLYYKNPSFKEDLAEYRKERNSHFEQLDFESLTEIKEELQDFQDDYTYWCDKGEQQTGRPKLWLQYEGEEYLSGVEGFFDDIDGNELDEDDIIDYNQYIQYWDGSNWKKKYIYSEYGDIQVEDITDDWIESFEQKVFVGTNRDTNSTRYSDYYYDPKEGVIWVNYITHWQGEEDGWDIIENNEEIDIVFVAYADDKIEELRPHLTGDLVVLRKYGELMEYYDLTDIYEIINLDHYQSLGTFSRENSGGEIFEHNESGRLIQYTWSAYQGSFRGYTDYDELI